MGFKRLVFRALVFFLLKTALVSAEDFSLRNAGAPSVSPPLHAGPPPGPQVPLLPVADEAVSARETKAFTIRGVNSADDIRRLTQINGLSIEALEARMRPGLDSQGKHKPPLDDGYDRSDEGFLGEREHLLGLLETDNKTVRERYRTTHQQMAKPLMDAIAIFEKGTEKDGEGFVTYVYPENSLSPETYKVKVNNTHGSQYSPFGDGDVGGSVVYIKNVTTGKELSTADLMPKMIEKYGFYEGIGTKYRLSPETIVGVFDYLEPYRK